jgi:hypothetical protein
MMIGRLAVALLVLPAWAASALAQPTPRAYAVVVGSNAGGDGQEPLQYAEQDATRFAALLTELGRVPREHVQLLLAPSAEELRARLRLVRQDLDRQAARGEPTQLIFYYSGHARAEAANLGREVLPLTELREALASLPTQLTVVILDACQSGAFSGVKGASPAADFSFNSVERLDAQGLAVMASSSGTELSQESEALAAGYFTHHLMTSMRGAGDANQDGRVSLDEAYRYAYEHTLADTARTRVGGQHVTLEMDVKGKGDVPLSYPGEASAQLVLAAGLAGSVLVQQPGHKAVMAEVVKAPNAPLRLALSPGRYDVVVRNGERVYECEAALREGAATTLALDRCEELSLDAWRAKGAPPPAPHEKWFLEGGVGVARQVDSAYVERLEVFGFESHFNRTQDLFVRATLGVMFTRHVGVTLSYQLLEQRSFGRRFDGPDGPSNADDVGWDAHRVAAGVRGSLPLFERWLVLYADASLGVALAPLYFDKQDARSKEELHAAASVDGALGVQSNVSRWFGLFAEGGWGWAPVPENLLGDRHNAAGGRVVLGLRLRTEGSW